MKENIIGRTIKSLRKEKQLKQKQLAEILGIKDSTVCKWENGMLEPDCDTIVAIAKYFAVTTDFLLGNE